MPGQYPIKSLNTTFNIIDALLEIDEAGVSELAEHTQKPKSTVHNHLKSLRMDGWIVVEEGRYRLSTKFLNIGNRVLNQNELYSVAKTQVDNLAAKTGEHASLMVEEDGLGVLLYTTTGTDAVELDTFPGMRMTLHTTAPGKAILAHLPEKKINDIISNYGLNKKTGKTITNREELIKELDDIRRNGFAFEGGERIEGLHSISTPILRSDSQVVGSLSIYGPGHRLAEDRIESELYQLLLEAKSLTEVNYTD